MTKQQDKLIIGAGTRQHKGYLHHDIQKLPGIDIVCNFWQLPLYVKKGSFKEIQMTHVLEHFPMADTQEALKLVHSLLAPNGKLYIEVPNFYWQASQIVANPLDKQMVEYAYGGQLNEWDFHYNGFTPEILNQELVEAGFTVDELNPNSSIECWSHT